MLSHTGGGGGGGDGGRGQRVEAEAEGRGQRAVAEAEGRAVAEAEGREQRAEGRDAHFFSPPSHIVEKLDYDREVIFLFLFCGFLIGRSVKNMNPSKSPFVEAIEDKVRDRKSTRLNSSHSS